MNERTVATAALSGVAAVAGSYAITGLTPAFVAAPVSAFVVESAPAPVVAWSIGTLGDLGHRLAFLFALALTAVLFALGALVSLWAAGRVDLPFADALLSAVVAALVALGLTGVPVPAAVAGIAAGLVIALATDGEARADEPVSAGRRRVVQAAAGLFTLGLLGAHLGWRREPTASVTEPLAGLGTGTAEKADDGVGALFEEARAKSLDIEGIPGLVSTFEEFYEVDINSINPTVDAADWTLTVTGAVDSDLVLDYDDLTSRTPEHRFNTLRCVGESLNGKKLDNAVWTGVPLMDLIDEAGLELEECCVMLRAADGYHVGFPLAALRNAFLAYGMNGEVLPRGHGYPVRALIPGHWGETNAKWLTEIEVLREPMDGYWEKRGWHGTGPVNTVAKLHAVNRLGDGRIQVGGHAYAGTRGVERVEVSVDGGGTWTDATLSEPLAGDDVWRQWEHTYEPAGKHDVVVRATDGEGNLQPRERHEAFPSGATGWVRRTVRP